MEIISVMMTLIIFLSIISMLIVLVLIYKFNGKVNIKIGNNKMIFCAEVARKEYKKEIDLDVYELITDGLKTNEDEKSKNSKVEILEEFKNIVSVVDIDVINLYFVVGSIFNASTVLANVTISTLVPSVYQNLFSGKGKLVYKIVPTFNDFKFEGTIDITFKITLFQFFLVYKWTKMISKRRRRV